MIADFVRSSGIDQLAIHSLVLILIAMTTVAVGLGWLADWVTRTVSFGILPNAIVLALSMMAGLVAYSTRVLPLKHADPALLVVVAIASAVLGLTALIFLRVRPYRA